MDLELAKALDDCTAAIGRLLDLLDQDRQGIVGCINGELLAEYQRGTDKALDTANEIKTGLSRLRSLE